MSEPIGWNVYSTAFARPVFLEFIPNEEALAPVASAFADWVEEYAAAEAACGAVLFPLPLRAPKPVEPVHPLDVPYFDPPQGPATLGCAREPDHDGAWHWDGKSTWFQ